VAKKRPNEEARRKQDRALQLRLAGFSYREISEQAHPDDPNQRLYSDASAAFNAVKAATQRADEDYEETTGDSRELDVARTERLTRALWARAMQGDDKAVGQIIRLMEVRAKLLGTLQRPADPEVKTPEGDMIDELANRRSARRAASQD
jgi:hypothetical protein